jgi:hypothetical protein
VRDIGQREPSWASEAGTLAEAGVGFRIGIGTSAELARAPANALRSSPRQGKGQLAEMIRSRPAPPQFERGCIGQATRTKEHQP